MLDFTVILSPMKKTLGLLLIVAAAIAAFYVDGSTRTGLVVKVAAVVVFLMGMMVLSARTPSKNQDDDVPKG